MLSRNDPRIRRAIDQITQNLESANERTQEGLYTFTHAYIRPCFTSFADCIASSTTPCCSGEDDSRRRHRARNRTQGRAEFSFDFYDDWEENETDALLGLEQEEGEARQPARERHMDYGTRQSEHILPKGSEADGTRNIPSSSYFGFMDRLPFRLGSKGLSYRPSIADLQDHPHTSRLGAQTEVEPLLPDSDTEYEHSPRRKRQRLRSGTHGSEHTTDSLSSRGDIFPSEDEMDDAVPLDDEFALALERRTTGHATQDSFSGRLKPAGTRSSSHMSINTMSSRKSTPNSKGVSAVVENHPSQAFQQISHDELGEHGPSSYSTPIDTQSQKDEVQVDQNTVSVDAARPRVTATSGCSPSQISSRAVGSNNDNSQSSLVSCHPSDASFNAAALPQFH